MTSSYLLKRNKMLERINHCVECIREITDRQPKIAITLGSGLGDFATKLKNTVEIPYEKIEGFPTPTVKGHAGKLIFGTYYGIEVVVIDGRVHFYEGYSQDEVVIPVRVMKKLGVKTIILSNAAGGVNFDYKPGDIMLISDHINYSGSNPLIGQNIDEFGPRFPDMSDVYNEQLRTSIKKKCEEENIKLQEGVYMMFNGPSFETPAEIRMARTLGADAVGMSTVPEAIVARHSGMNVIGMSLITNMAAGMLKQKLNHKEVLDEGKKAEERFTKVITLTVKTIDENEK